jgi:uncharacterized membrane protein
VDPRRPGLANDTSPARQLWHRADDFVRGQLTWNRLYRATSYVRSALWIVPFLAILLVLVVAPTLVWFDEWLGSARGFGTQGAQALYQTVITLTLSFIVFTFGSLLVAVQIAGGQLTPRIIATTLLRDNVVRYTVGLFVFTLIFAVMALDRLENQAHEIVSLVVALLGITCIAAFLFLIDYAARLLRPVSIVARVADDGLAVIDALYPKPTGHEEGEAAGAFDHTGLRVVLHDGASEIVVAVDFETLVREARWADGIVEFVPQVGDFVATGEPLFVLYGGAAGISDQLLRTTVAFGPERTMEQDPMFSFRILVDIALKALSPAINDPTTAVLAIDQVHRLLRVVGGRHLRGEAIRDLDGRPRVIHRTPNWEDFVQVSCHEIRANGAGQIQVVRRLRAMLDNLTATLPPHRHQVLNDERQRLDQAIAASYPVPADLALAREPDAQGLGGTRPVQSVRQ